jgi:hypothetical protein
VWHRCRQVQWPVPPPDDTSTAPDTNPHIVQLRPQRPRCRRLARGPWRRPPMSPPRSPEGPNTSMPPCAASPMSVLVPLSLSLPHPLPLCLKIWMNVFEWTIKWMLEWRFVNELLIWTFEWKLVTELLIWMLIELLIWMFEWKLNVNCTINLNENWMLIKCLDIWIKICEWAIN